MGLQQTFAHAAVGLSTPVESSPKLIFVKATHCHSFTNLVQRQEVPNGFGSSANWLIGPCDRSLRMLAQRGTTARGLHK